MKRLLNCPTTTAVQGLPELNIEADITYGCLAPEKREAYNALHLQLQSACVKCV